MVESAIDAAPFRFGDLTSIAPPLILSASWECVGDAPLSATPPSISVSDILCGGVDFVGCLAVHVEADFFWATKKFEVRAHLRSGPPRFLAASQASSACIAPTSPLKRLRASFTTMPPSICLRSFSRLSIDAAAHSSSAARLLHPRAAFFSTSAARHATGPKRKGVVAAPKKGLKSLNTKKGKKAATGDAGKRPAQGDRKAQRKRIVLSNNNALEVLSLKDLEKKNVLSEQNEGKVMGLPADTVDALRDVEAFKTTQGWSLFRRPAVLMRKEAIQLARLFKEVEESAAGQQKRTIRRILSGDRMSGKSTLLLQGLTMGFLREWFVINLPEGKHTVYEKHNSVLIQIAQDIVNAHTEYAPLPDSQPTQYTQDAYTANLLQQIQKSNGAFLQGTKLSTNPDLPLPLPANATLKDLVALGQANPEASWPVFVALWNELSQPGRPPIVLAIDSLSHIMRNSQYLSADVKPIHAHDLTLIRHFIDHLSGAKNLPNGGIVLGATSQSNSPTSPALDFSIEVAEARQKTPDNIPQWNPYKNVDGRVMEVLKDLHTENNDFDVIHVGGLTKEEARAIMEYYAESGLLRHTINEGFVSEKWSLAGMGNIGELERTSVRLRI